MCELYDAPPDAEYTYKLCLDPFDYKKRHHTPPAIKTFHLSIYDHLYILTTLPLQFSSIQK